MTLKLYYYWHLLLLSIGCCFRLKVTKCHINTSSHLPLSSSMLICKWEAVGQQTVQSQLFLRKFEAPTLEDSKIIRSENVVAVFILVLQGDLGILGPQAESFNHIRAQEKLHIMTQYQKTWYFRYWHETVQTWYHGEVAASSGRNEHVNMQRSNTQKSNNNTQTDCHNHIHVKTRKDLYNHEDMCLI